MEEWNKNFHGIAVRYHDRIVGIQNDEVLRAFLEDRSSKGSLLLADAILKEYKAELGKPLRITRDSLAIEIIGHVFLDKFSDLSSVIANAEVKKLLEELKEHTEIIDCGEKEADSNRVVWDSLEKEKGLIYMLCGKHA